MTTHPMTDTTDTSDLDELRALRDQQAARHVDAEMCLAQLDEQLQALRAQQATERADGASQRADAAVQIAQLNKRIRTREAADAAGEVDILTPEVLGDGGGTPKEWRIDKFCNSPHPTDRYSSCKRFAGHEGDHAAFTFRISAPEQWANTKGE